MYCKSLRRNEELKRAWYDIKAMLLFMAVATCAGCGLYVFWVIAQGLF